MTSPEWKQPGRDDVPDLAPVERDGDVRAHRGAGHLAGRRVDTGRDVDGEHGHACGVDALDRGCGFRARLAVEAGAEAARR